MCIDSNNNNNNIRQLLLLMFDLRKQLKKCDNYDQVIISKNLMTIKTIDGKVLPVYDDHDGDDSDNNSNDDINEDNVYTHTYGGNDNVYNRNYDDGDNNKLSSNNEKESSNNIDKDNDDDSDDDNDDYNDSINELTEFSVEISRSLYELLINIQKLLTPLPVNISQRSPKEYCQIIIAHLHSIHNANEFDINNSNFFIRIDDDEKKKKGTLNFILNKEEEEKKKENEEEEIIGGLIIKGISFKKISFQQYSSEKLVTLIINLYNLSIEEYMSTEIMRRHQFDTIY